MLACCCKCPDVYLIVIRRNSDYQFARYVSELERTITRFLTKRVGASCSLTTLEDNQGTIRSFLRECPHHYRRSVWCFRPYLELKSLCAVAEVHDLRAFLILRGHLFRLEHLRQPSRLLVSLGSCQICLSRVCLSSSPLGL